MVQPKFNVGDQVKVINARDYCRDREGDEFTVHTRNIAHGCGRDGGTTYVYFAVKGSGVFEEDLDFVHITNWREKIDRNRP